MKAIFSGVGRVGVGLGVGLGVWWGTGFSRRKEKAPHQLRIIIRGGWVWIRIRYVSEPVLIRIAFLFNIEILI